MTVTLPTVILPLEVVLLAQIWAIGYLVVILAVILGLAVVARPSGRKAWKD
jgi:hypothetical protein